MIGGPAKEFEQVRRRMAFRDEYLRWLYRLHVAGTDSPGYSRFLDESSGPSCEEIDIHRATKWLKEMGFISGLASAQTQGGVVRPCITTLGINRIEQNGSVNDQERAAVNINATNSNVAVGSPSAIQSLTITEGVSSDVKAAIDGLAALLIAPPTALTAAHLNALRDAAEELEDEISRDEVRPVRVRKWLERASVALFSVGAVADVSAVAGLIQTALGSLP